MPRAIRSIAAFLRAPWGRGADVIITGIPRSGTSFFTSALHKLENCVAINEPDGIFAHLDNTQAPWGMASYYRSLRQQILARVPITNKLVNGNVIEDTAVVDKEDEYVPHIRGRCFTLATKNTLGYLARLPYLARALPEAVFVACVRNPFATIASWKDTFPHLRDATVESFRKGFEGDHLMSATASERLREIAQTKSLAARRALLWRHLALLIHESRNVFTKIFSYEDLVQAPEKQLSTLITNLPQAPRFRLNQALPAGLPRWGRLANLSDAERETIKETCSETALLFGYNLESLPMPPHPTEA